jgi:hypothetical protein
MSALAIGGYYPNSFRGSMLYTGFYQKQKPANLRLFKNHDLSLPKYPFDSKNDETNNPNIQINKILLSIKPIEQRWVFNELEELRMIADHSNWDNLGSAPFDDDTYQIARRFLWALPSSLAAPELTVDRDGEINFDWFGLRGQILTVSLRKDGRIAYACRISQRRNYSGTEDFIDSIPKKIVESIKSTTT